MHRYFQFYNGKLLFEPILLHYYYINCKRNLNQNQRINKNVLQLICMRYNNRILLNGVDIIIS